MNDNPFKTRMVPLSGPAVDCVPVALDNDADLPTIAASLYVGGTAGNVHCVTVAGEERTIPVAAFSILPVGVLKVFETGTTATELFALVV